MEHFEFFDLTTSTLVTHKLFPGSCDPGDDVCSDEFVELRASEVLVTSQYVEDISPLATPICHLKAGHRYRVRMKPQKVLGCAMSIAELFRGCSSLAVGEVPQAVMVDLSSDDEAVLMVED